MKDFPVSELRQVAVSFQGNQMPTHYYMHKDDVALFLRATVELHYQPGKNPYNGASTALLWKVEVSDNYESSVKWWTTPGLGLGVVTLEGAETLNFYSISRVWTHPDLLEQEKKQQEDNDIASERFG